MIAFKLHQKCQRTQSLLKSLRTQLVLCSFEEKKVFEDEEVFEEKVFTEHCGPISSMSHDGLDNVGADDNHDWGEDLTEYNEPVEHNEPIIKVEPVVRNKRKRSEKISEETMEDTTDLVNDSNDVHCIDCCKQFLSLATLTAHLLRTHKNRKSVQCEYCLNTFFTETIANHRLRCKKHPEKIQKKIPKLACTYCSSRFNSIRNYKLHLLSDHLEMKNQACRYCNILTFADLLELHENSCSKSAKTYQKADLEKEIDSANLIACPECGKMFKRSSIDQHIDVVHSKKEVVICDYCNSNFINKFSLINHIKNMHLGRNHICNVCKIVFNKYGRMADHRRRDHSELYPPFKCTKCEFTTPNCSKIREHELRHLGDVARTYACNECSQKFFTSQTLKKHMNSHIKVRNVGCELCGKMYKTEHDLRKHKNFVHSEKAYECPVCEKTFGTNQNMRLHCSTKHPEYQLPISGTIMKKDSNFRGRLNVPLQKKMSIRASLPQTKDEKY